MMHTERRRGWTAGAVTEHVTADMIHVITYTEKQNTLCDKNISGRHTDPVFLKTVYYLHVLVWPNTMEPSCNGSQYRVPNYSTFSRLGWHLNFSTQFMKNVLF